ncbi:MAG: hypothetical protein ABSE21_14200 [Bryobacteraceae bacterium]|jgi:hypothetical protein
MNRGIRIDAGSAAKAAEQSREADAAARGEFKGPTGIRMTRAVGQKFELPGGPATQAGEALPVAPSAAREQGSAQGQEQAIKEAPEASSPSLTSRISGIFRSLFGRGAKKS